MKKQVSSVSGLLNSLREINQFVKGGKFNTLKQHIKRYEELSFRKDFYTAVIYSGKEYKQDALNHSSKASYNTSAFIFELEILLTELNIPRSHWGRYLNVHFSLYELLCQLNADLKNNSTIQLNSVLELIEAKTAWDKKVFFLGGGVLVALLAVSPVLAGLIELGKVIMASVIAIPILSALSNLGSSAYFAYHTYFDKKRSLFNRLRDNFFLLLNNIFNISGSIVWLASGSIVAPIASAILFLCASLVNVVKEVFSMVQNYFEYKKHMPFIGQDLHGQKEYVRHQLSYRQHRNAAMINIATAIVICALMAVCLFVPGGLFVAVGVLLATGVVYQLNAMALKKNKSVVREQLQAELCRLQQENEAKNEQTIGCSYSYLMDEEYGLEQENQSERSYEHEATTTDASTLKINLKETKVKTKGFSYSHVCSLSFFGFGSGAPKEKTSASKDSMALGI